MKLAFDEREEEVGDSGAENEGQNANLRRSGLGKNGGSYHTKLIWKLISNYRFLTYFFRGFFPLFVIN